MSDGTIDRLAAMLADLDHYVQDRAEELAAPLIEQARAKAAEQVRSAAVEMLRLEDALADLEDVAGERLKRMDVLARRADEAEAARKRLAALLGYREPSALPLAALVDQIEAGYGEQHTTSTEGTAS